MPTTWGGFAGGSGFTNKGAKEEILALGEQIDSDLVCGKRSRSELTKDENRALKAYKLMQER